MELLYIQTFIDGHKLLENFAVMFLGHLHTPDLFYSNCVLRIKHTGFFRVLIVVLPDFLFLKTFYPSHDWLRQVFINLHSTAQTLYWEDLLIDT